MDDQQLEQDSDLFSNVYLYLAAGLTGSLVFLAALGFGLLFYTLDDIFTIGLVGAIVGLVAGILAYYVTRFTREYMS